MKEKLLNNLGIKIGSIFLAFIVWILVANVDDYSVTKQITGIPVIVQNESAITKQGKVYEISEGNTVDIIVKGRRTVVDNLGVEDFTATADMSNLSITNSVQIAVVANKNSVNKEIDIAMVNSTMKVNIEERGEQKLPITVTTIGEPANGYAVVSKTATPNMVTISGAESVISKIKTVQIAVDVEGQNADVVTTGMLQFLDSDGDPVDSSKIRTETSDISVTVVIQKTKEVPITVQTSGDVAEGYKIANDIEYQPTTVIIAGDETTLRGINSIIVNDIDVAGMSQDYETTVDIDAYLPEGVIVADGNSQLAIKIIIEKMVQKAITIDSKDILLSNKDENYTYTIQEADNLSVSVQGLSTDVDKVDIKALSPSIDVDGLTRGTRTVVVQFADLDGITIIGEIEVAIKIETKQNTEASTSTTTETTE